METQPQTNEQPTEQPTEKPLPEFLTRLPNGNLMCRTSEGEYEFTDLPYDKTLAVKQRAVKFNNGNPVLDGDLFELILISESLVNKKVGELTIRGMKTSTVLRMKMAIAKLYDLTSFLSLSVGI